MPTFKHLVIEGNLVTFTDTLNKKDNIGLPTQQTIKKTVGWKPNITIHNSSKYINSYEILRLYSKVIRTKIAGDTLYVSFYKKNAKEHDSPLNFLTITSKNLESVSINNTHYTLEGNYTDLKVASNKSIITLDKIKANKLQFFVNGSNIHLYENAKIEHLSYSLKSNSSLSTNPNTVKSFSRIYADSTSDISIRDIASKMERYLPMAKN